MHRLSPATLALAVIACGSPTEPGPLPARTVVVISGGGQHQLAGYPLAEPIVLEARDERGNPVAGASLTLSTTSGASALSATELTTDGDGRATVSWRLGTALGAQQVDGLLDAPGGPFPFSVTAEATGNPVLAISGDTYRACAVYLDGRMGCFGIERDPPLVPPTVTEVPGARRYRDVAVLENLNNVGFEGCALDDAGRAWCFDLDHQTHETSNWQALAGNYPSLHGIKGAFAISPLVQGTFCATSDQGALWCWGSNLGGALGDGTETPTLVPQQVPLPWPVATFTVGSNFACASAADGVTWCWGSNFSGQLGRPGSADRLPPAPVHENPRFDQLVALGFDGGACGTRQGAVHCWGAAHPPEIRALLSQPERYVPTVAASGAVALAAGPADFIMAIQGGGEATWWGHFPLLHAPQSQHVRQPARYPVPFTEVLQNVVNDIFCGRTSQQGGVLCFITEMFTSYPAFVVSPQRLVGFGVPGLP